MEIDFNSVIWNNSIIIQDKWNYKIKNDIKNFYLYKIWKENINICYLWETLCNWITIPFIIKINNNNFLYSKKLFNTFINDITNKYSPKLHYIRNLYNSKVMNLIYLYWLIKLNSFNINKKYFNPQKIEWVTYLSNNYLLKK